MKGEVCKAIICLEIVATRYVSLFTLMGFFFLAFELSFFVVVERVVVLVNRHGALFDRQSAIKLSGMSEKAYNRSFNLLQNGLDVKWVFYLLFI